MAKKSKKNKRKQQYTSKVPNDLLDNIPENGMAVLKNIGGNIVLSEFEEELTQVNNRELSVDYIKNSSYNVETLTHLYNQIIAKDASTYVTTNQELSTLAQNTQSNKDKVIKINGIAKYYINKEDLIGKVTETLENNVSTTYTMNYPNISFEDDSTKESFEELKTFIDKINKQIDIQSLISKNLLTTYIEGNTLYYLMGDSTKGYNIITYPLDIVDITTLSADGDPLLVFNVQELKQRLQQSQNKYGTLKAEQPVELLSVINDMVERDYPSEVFEAFSINDRFVYLNPARTGVCRINNYGGQYGVTPIFKAIAPQLMLETFDTVDRNNIIARGKKIYHQITRKELLGKDGQEVNHITNVGYAHNSFLMAMRGDQIVYTSMPYVEEIKILEPSIEATPIKTVESYRNRVLNALGIGFLAGDGTGLSSINVNVSELLKTVNKITRQLEATLNKYYKVICSENGYDIALAPTISIHPTEEISFESKCKLVDLYYSKLGLSYETIFEKLGLDYNTEINRRKTENEHENSDGTKGMDNIFSPHATSYTMSKEDQNNGDSSMKADNEVNENGSKKSKNSKKSEYDKELNKIKKNNKKV